MSVVFDQSMANIEPYGEAKKGGKGTVLHKGFTKSAEKEIPDIDL